MNILSVTKIITSMLDSLKEMYKKYVDKKTMNLKEKHLLDLKLYWQPSYILIQDL